MERTPQLVRITIDSLPPPPDPIIVDYGGLPDGGGAVDQGGRAGAVDEVDCAEGGIDGRASAAEDLDHTAGHSIDSAEGKQYQNFAIAGWNGYNQNLYDQYSDLYLHGRPVCEFWETLWKALPLVLHDKDLLSVGKYIARSRKNRGFSSNLTQEITSVLENHPGPISYFRIDSSVWNVDGEQLDNWLGTLSDKGVQELIIINKGLPTNVSFPITRLQTPNLTFLSLGFLNIAGLGVNAFNHSSLTVLQLTGCTYDGQTLSAVISECVALQNLIIGCSGEDLKITSQSLQCIQMWKCSASWLIIEYAPKLHILSTGIRPRNGEQSVIIDINGSGALRELNYLMLPFHDINITSASISQGLICLASVAKVRMGIEMGSLHQRSGLMKILQRLPMLTDLVIWRTDEVGPNEDSDSAVDSSVDGLGSLQCLRFCLRYLLMEEFRGGHAEVAVVTCILRNAPNLVEVKIEPYMLSSGHTDEAAKKIDNCPRASAGCQVIFHQPRKEHKG